MTIAEELNYPKYHGDFCPDLKQDLDLYDVFVFYIKNVVFVYNIATDVIRVKIPSRYNKIEQNVPYIHSIVLN